MISMLAGLFSYRPVCPIYSTHMHGRSFCKNYFFFEIIFHFGLIFLVQNNVVLKAVSIGLSLNAIFTLLTDGFWKVQVTHFLYFVIRVVAL
jgi:protein-S-isoprenylcysteine O-methyltransferase Ste14